MSVDIGIVIQSTVALISIICSCLTIIIIYAMNKWNGYVIMIVNLSIAQGIYDISIIMASCNSIACFITEEFLRYFAGMAASLWTNVILTVVAYVVFKLQAFNTTKYFWYLFSIVVFPSLGVAIVQLLINIDKFVYYWARIISILYNVVVYLLVKRQLQLMSSNESNYSWWSYIVVWFQYQKSSISQDPVRLLAYRLKYYPIVQIVCRFGVSWFEFITDSSGFDYRYHPSWPIQVKIAFFIYSITQPAAGIGFFIVYLYVSPGGYRMFLALLGVSSNVDINEQVSADTMTSMDTRNAKPTLLDDLHDDNIRGSNDYHENERNPSYSSADMLTASLLSYNPSDRVHFDYSECDDEALAQAINEKYAERMERNTLSEKNG